MIAQFRALKKRHLLRCQHPDRSLVFQAVIESPDLNFRFAAGDLEKAMSADHRLFPQLQPASCSGSWRRQLLPTPRGFGRRVERPNPFPATETTGTRHGRSYLRPGDGGEEA